ncbi:MAG: hypothetical protein BWY09_01591 [Candidatus Hydrogenedentes bacterium ADurb.Bin179]|nr:MAG: hypothetical protein BWY09_01591 [Candidatus Hydrogenedentes bacterium ADurb.Bin179]
MVQQIGVEIPRTFGIPRPLINTAQSQHGVRRITPVSMGREIGFIFLCRLRESAPVVVDHFQGKSTGIQRCVHDHIRYVIPQRTVIMGHRARFIPNIESAVAQIIFQARLVTVGNFRRFQRLFYHALFQVIKGVHQMKRAAVAVVIMKQVLPVNKNSNQPSA